MKITRRIQIHNTEKRRGVLGPLVVVNTGQHTVRSANDRCVVRDKSTENEI